MLSAFGGRAASFRVHPGVSRADPRIALLGRRLEPGQPVVVSPAPGTRTASRTTQISFLGVAPAAIGPVVVTGSRSGAHPGVLRPYSDGAGASFLPARPFDAGEAVTVRTGLDLVGAPSGTFRFVVGERVPVTPGPKRPGPELSTGVERFASAPGLVPPQVRVVHSSPAARPGGDFFLAPKGAVGQFGPMIVGPTGRLIWFHPLPPGEVAFSFDLQRYRGRPALVWFQGRVVRGHGVGEDVIASTSYRRLAVIRGGNGFAPDLHELQLDGATTALVTSYQALRWPVSLGGVPRTVTALDGIVQAIDVPTGLVMFEWHSLDHVPVTRSDFALPAGPAGLFDYFHVNSIQQLPDGSLLVGSRNTSAAYDVSVRDGGRVLWQLGGRGSTFALGPGARFAFQHDTRLVTPDTMTIFDDEAAPRRGPQSRALVLHLDLRTRRATLVRAYTHPDPPLLAAALGNVQLLANGDVVVGWGTTPYVSQFTQAGRLLLDLELPAGDDTYRATRHPFVGRPATPPSVALARLPSGALRVEVSWNGATQVAAWRARTGPTPAELRPGASAPDAGFQTSFAIARPGRWVAVEAIDAAGHVLGRSRVLAVPSR